ncbi:MAG: hypothetical protein OEX81_01850 [Candidatus Pacebacteria bacterium]|nr:hypothetical protein [Candidatus Paceibacterota bacterium]
MFKLFRNPLFIIIATAITIVFYISLSKTQQKTLSTDQKIKLSQEEKIKLEAENKILEQKLQTSNPEFSIRDEFLMYKEGEYVVKVPSLPKEDEESEKNKEESNLDKWRKLIF